ncbi:hypothetical protein WH221_22390 [Chryseobacterium culicis]|uniref:Uncharacterized protein n=1 Tax=Chryseobacterium culicis TaxID=680127 RepID=A0A2S9CHU3_CHRCI|nr:hypothetical protein [Chryseobacterium culicis]PRB80082.1 hypothetical protein CQ022_22315 [Chryseobacterium culicis]PRB87284.1 hypothetical protein CQ033_22650 [Chryseobacterium culicis]
MQLKHFYLALDENDYHIQSNDKSEKKYNNDKIVSDFNFQTDYFTHFIEMNLRKLKYETESYNMLLLRAKKKPSDFFSIEPEFKSLTIEVFFDENKYEKLYPFKNEYPLNGKLLKPIEDENLFHVFLFNIINEGLDKGKKLNAPIPYWQLKEIVLDFKNKNFQNEWMFKSKIFKDLNIKVSLYCRLTINYFTLEIIIEKNKIVVLKKEILRTLPSSIMYNHEFKDIIFESGKIKVMKDRFEPSTLYEVSLDSLI